MHNVYSTVIWTGGLLYDLRMHLIAQRRNVVRHLHFNGGLTIINQIRNMTIRYLKITQGYKMEGV